MSKNDEEDSSEMVHHSLEEDEHMYTISMDPSSLGIVMEGIVVHPGAEIPWLEEIGVETQMPSAAESTLCRVCAEDSLDLVHIFQEQGMKLELEKKIHLHLPIQVTEDDNLPTKMCLTCVRRLNACHNLANLCMDAELKLESIYNPHNINDNKLDDIDTKKTAGNRKSALPSDRLMKAMQLIRHDKEQCHSSLPGYESLSGNDGEEDDGHESSNNETFEAVYLEDHAASELKGSQILDVVIEPVGRESLPPGKWTTAELRVKIPKNFAECDTSLKSQIVGAIQDIMIEEDQVGISKRRHSGTRRSKTEWKCDICGHIAPRQSSLLVHQRRNHSKPFACSYCYKTFTNGVARIAHQRSHALQADVEAKVIKTEADDEEEEEQQQEQEEDEDDDQSIYVCEHCGRSFERSKELIEHLLSEHADSKPYKCNKCGKGFGTATSLDVHGATHSSDLPYLCDLCGKKFKHKSNLRCHKRSHLGIDKKNGQICKTCGKGFRSQFHLNEHTNIHENKKPYSCDVCAKRFHKKIQLRQHGSTHSGVQPFHCHICGVRFNRRGNMTQHLKRHERNMKYSCKVCSLGFDTLGSLLQHRKNHSKEELDSSVLRQLTLTDEADLDAYKCNICQKLLAKKESLALHMRSHTGEKLFSCDVCGKRLSNKGSLTYHMRSYHTGERPYSCRYCTDAFLTKEAMNVHERIHTGEKPFTCGVCFMGFRCASNLSQHVKVHTNNRPFACPHCEKTFLRKGALTVHLRVHTGERPYICDQCGRGFTQKNDMLKHRRTHTLEKPFSCSECGLMFSQKRELTKHHLLHLDPMESIEEMVEPHTVVITTSEDHLMQTFATEVIDNAQSLISVLQF